jgi:hypothetical protein
MLRRRLIAHRCRRTPHLTHLSGHRESMPQGTRRMVSAKSLRSTREGRRPKDA